MQKECPMCGDRMTLHTRETVTRVPGTSQEIRTVVREWVCQECEYFEEADEN
jgi:C4-type Zn-finger protein